MLELGIESIWGWGGKTDLLKSRDWPLIKVIVV